HAACGVREAPGQVHVVMRCSASTSASPAWPSRNHTPEELRMGLADSHAATVKHTVIRVENTIGRIKRYVQVTTVMAAKHSASAHTVVRMTARVSAGRLPSCHANAAA